jgi:hypothetical protein
MTTLATFHLPVGAYLGNEAVSLELHLTVAGADGFMECCTRQGLPGLLRLMGAKQGAEVGVQRGEFSSYLLQHWEGELFLVDLWKHQPDGYDDVANVSDGEHSSNLSATYQAMKAFGGRGQIVIESSLKMANLLGPASLDFVYLDGNHSYEAVLADLAAWSEVVRPGGMVAGHDFVDYDGPLGKFGVRSAVIEFTQRTGRQLYVSKEAWPSLWYFIRE